MGAKTVHLRGMPSLPGSPLSGMPAPTCRPPLAPAAAAANRIPVQELAQVVDPLVTPFIDPFVGKAPVLHS